MLRPRRFVAALGVALLASCAANVPPVPLDPFVRGDLEPVRAFFDEQLRHGDAASGALFMNGLAQVELYSEQFDDARRHFQTAGRLMGNWAASAGEVAGAILGSESSKTWRGDPHEKAMNAFYTGYLYWLKGQPDNGRAGFRRGILADAESDEGEFQVDFALLFWLAGRASLEMGLTEDADGLFEEARRAREFAVSHGARGAATAEILADPSRGNLIVLAELGLGPRKVAGGPQRSLAIMLPRRISVAGAEVFVDGVSVGRSTLLADIDYQAQTRGGQEMQGIRDGKAVFKQATALGGAILLADGLNDHGSGGRDSLIVGGVLLLLSLLTSAEADTRHWETLPQTVHALTAEVAPGRHEVRIEFLGPSGGGMPWMTQTRTLDVKDGRDCITLFRSMPPVHRTEIQP